MRVLLALLLLFVFTHIKAQNDEAELEKRLYNLPDVQFKKVSKQQDKYLKYLLRIKQPLNHQNPTEGFFNQFVMLTHKGFEKPVVMETEGYELHEGGNEIEKILEANNINIEHRYFGKSRPDSLQWDNLTFEQVTADLHKVNKLLRTIYPNKWVSTGISRGGQVAIYYRSFYPADVDLTIPYVAPLPNALEDKRIYHFLDTIGSAECREKIFHVQQFLLSHETEAINKLKWYAKGKKLTFDHLGSLGKAFEFAVLEYPFAFWQIGSVPCERIPTNKSVDDYLEHIINVGGIEFFSDKSITDWVPNGYMAKTQMGFYGYNLQRFKKNLRYIKGENPSAAFVPTSVPVKPFDSSFTQGISRWLDAHGNNILYIYGSIDTWSACRVIVSDKTNAKSYLIPNVNHYKARIKNMPAEMQEDFVRRVKEMTELSADLKALK